MEIKKSVAEKVIAYRNGKRYSFSKNYFLRGMFAGIRNRQKWNVELCVANKSEDFASTISPLAARCLRLQIK